MFGVKPEVLCPPQLCAASTRRNRPSRDSCSLVWQCCFESVSQKRSSSNSSQRDKAEPAVVKQSNRCFWKVLETHHSEQRGQRGKSISRPIDRAPDYKASFYHGLLYNDLRGSLSCSSSSVLTLYFTVTTTCFVILFNSPTFKPASQDIQ